MTILGSPYIPEQLNSIAELLFHTSSHVHPGLAHTPNVKTYNEK